MFFKTIYIKIGVFILGFSCIFSIVRYFHLLPQAPTTEAFINIPVLFSAISLIFSVISGFIIQSKWQTWNELIDATHGEISSLKQLHILADHFPPVIQKTMRTHIFNYLKSLIAETSYFSDDYFRSAEVESSIYKLEETVLDINYDEHPNIGALAFDLVRKCLEFREKRLQNVSHRLPAGVRFFIIWATFSIIFSSLFVAIDVLIYDYLFTLILALLSFGIYLLIDDLDHPYRPGQWQLTKGGYITLSEEVVKSINNPEVKTHKIIKATER